MTTVDTKAGCCIPGSLTRRDVIDTARIKKSDRAKGNELNSVSFITLAGGWFRMGADDGPYPQDGESPERDVYVDSFALAATAVCVDEFANFINATGYQTVAERIGSSFVFYKHCDPEQSYAAPAQAPWWRQVAGACWRTPYGEHVNADGRKPAVHIAHADTQAYCQWSGTRLPTEAEWEFAARGALECHPFPWGSQLMPEGNQHTNVWQGDFPNNKQALQGHHDVVSVDAFEPQGFGHYNMIGNVWEWVADRFTDRHSPRAVKNPKGPLNGSNFVAKGGSYLCHESYCARYRTSSRQALPADTTSGNIGFRVASPTFFS